jgi:ankyrin repeat protein
MTTAVVILGFAHRRSVALQHRLETGVAFYLSQPAGSCYLITTGGDTNSSGTTEAHDLRTAAVSMGVPPSRILAEDQARYTIENALLVYRMLEAAPAASPIREVFVVTNEFHMKRSLLIFRGVSSSLPSRAAPPPAVSSLPAPAVTPLPAPDGDPSLLLAETGRSLPSWQSSEEKQLSLLRSECGSDFGNLLAQRILAHDRLPVAAKLNNLGALRAWRTLNPGMHLDGERMRGGSTSLHYAVLYRNPAAAKWLVENGSSPDLPNDNGATPRHFLATVPAKERGQIEEALGDPPAAQAGGRSALWGSRTISPEEAIPLSRTKLRQVGSLLAFGDVVYSQLIECARDGDVDGVRGWIAENGEAMGVDGPDGYAGTTALAHAASGGSAECVSLLLESGADVSLPKSPRSNALHYAAFKLHNRCADVLVAGGGEERVKRALESRGESALWASLGGMRPNELALYVSVEAKAFSERLGGKLESK